jgi:endonuclease/exonuclease/phosphatase (EEP) superfamily protein YafD
MTTSLDDTSYAPTEQRGIFKRLIAFASGVYLIGMLAYLAIRLIFGDQWWWVALLNAFAIYTFLPAFILGPLATLAGMWRVATRMGLLAILAVVWFGPFFQPPSVSPSGAPTIRVSTFNMLGNNPTPEQVISWLRDVDADVVLLQEVPPSFRDSVEAELTDLYPESQFDDITNNWNMGMLSKYPIIAASDFDDNSRIQRVTLEINGQEIAVYNVHFQVPIQEDSHLFETGFHWLDLALHYDEDGRNEQIAELLTTLKTEPLPFIVAGDFNMSQHTITYSSVAVAMTDSFRRTESGLGATFPATLSIIPPLLRIDYVWYQRNAFRAIDTHVGPHLGSDHLPVIADIEMLFLTREPTG